MNADFPAAHSMDTAWYAVDRDGYVGVFVTGEEGHMPSGAANDYDASLPALSDELQGGLFTFEYDEDYSEYAFWVQPYARTHVPAQPLHIDQLPPRLRKAYRRVRFDALRFAEAEHVQPWEFGVCDGWGASAAYITADFSTVRPVPGSEEDFHALCLEAKKHLPPELKNLRFEEPEEEPKPRRRAPRRRKKSGDADER
jgi:hypothetical protein